MNLPQPKRQIILSLLLLFAVAPAATGGLEIGLNIIPKETLCIS